MTFQQENRKKNKLWTMMPDRQGSRPKISWLSLAVALLILVSVYLLIFVEHVRFGQGTVSFRVLKASSRYPMLSSGAWSESAWSKNCTTSGGRHLCQLPDTWRDCSRGIYLDVGSNVGVQIRKLYSPEQFANAPVLPVFDKFFGTNRSGVCALGVEANPDHTSYLNLLNAFFKRKGYQAVVLTEVAASIRSGSATFFLDKNSPVQWGASLTQGAWQNNGNKSSQATVQVLDLSQFITEVVLPMVTQDKQLTGYRPNIVMKLDVEGEEYALLPSMILSGALCNIDVVFMEQHQLIFRNAVGKAVNMTLDEIRGNFSKMRMAHPACRVMLSGLDDETYRDGMSIPFPP